MSGHYGNFEKPLHKQQLREMMQTTFAPPAAKPGKVRPLHSDALHGKKPVREKPIIASSRPPGSDEISAFMWQPTFSPIGQFLDMRFIRNGAPRGLALQPIAMEVWLDRFDRELKITRTEHVPIGNKYDGAKLRELRAERGCGRPPSKRKKSCVKSPSPSLLAA